MTAYAWVGRTRGGRIVNGQRTAASAAALAASLSREQILVTRITPMVRPGRWQHRVSPKSLAVFTRQFSVMIDAGLPLVQCLGLLSREEPDRRLAGAIEQIKTEVEGGAALADAMEKRPYAFDALYASMVAAGEAGGILDVILRRLASFIEQQAKLASRIRSAMAYPVAVLGIAVVVVTAILWKVVPTFTALFEGLNATLPWPTRMVIWVSRTLVVLLPFLTGATLLAFYGSKRYYQTSNGRTRIDGWRLRAPIVGTVARKVAVARFCRTLSTLIGSGVPILSGLDITARTSGNAVIEHAIREVRSRVERGETLSQPLRATGAFPPLVVQMIGVGEHAGALDAMLAKIAEFYEDEVDVAVDGLLALLEPALISVLGLVVGAIVVAMYLPLFDLINQLS